MSGLLLFLLPSLLTIVAASNNTFQNPILPGFHPDPSCISVSDHNWTFFCASSSFSVFPGIPVHASRDLVDWKLVSNAISRPSQLPDLAITNKSTSGIWAPTLRYHNGLFYLMSTLVFDDLATNNGSRWQNFLLTTSDVYNSSAWSDPVFFDFEGYDTSPFWDDDGTTYVYPAIRQGKLDFATGKIGDLVDIWNGTGGLAPEGPHIYKKDRWYYLMIAEGGTGVNHEVDIARSRNINGPYEAGVNPSNPILTQANTSSYFQTVGHADLFQDKGHNWWGVALSTRSGPEYSVYPMGRETVLAPVSWRDDGWPVWTNVSGIMNSWPLPTRQLVTKGEGPLVNAPDDLDFCSCHNVVPNTSGLPPQIVHWRIPIEENYVLAPPEHDCKLQLTPSLLNLTGYDGNYAGPAGQTFVARRQVDTFFTFSVDLNFMPERLEEEAGVSIFLVQNHHFDLGVVLLPQSASSTASNTSADHNKEAELMPYFRFRGISYLPTPSEVLVPIDAAWLAQTLTLEIKTANYTHYALSAAPAAHQHLMQTIAYAPAADLSFGFTGTLVGVYATTNGRGNVSSIVAGPKAYISRWRYQGQGQVRN